MKNVFKLIGIIAIVAIISFSFATCSDGGNDTGGTSGGTGGDVSAPILDLAGTITINPSTNVIINTELTATYSGSETVTYQWKKDGSTTVGANSNKYTPITAGSYTVTISAEGYNSKTSAVIDVNDPSLSTLSGNITISPNSGVTTYTELTATYSGSETVSYHWEKDGISVGANSNKFTPTTTGNYTVTVSAKGYNPKTSNSVTVTNVWKAVTQNIFESIDVISAIAYGNNKFVAGDDSGGMAYSSDGTTWTAVSNSTFGNSSICAIAYANNIFVAGGYDGKMAYLLDD